MYVAARYNEFNDLKEELKQQYGAEVSCSGEFPRKIYLGISPMQLEERKTALGKWLNLLISNLKTKDAAPLHNFVFRVGKSVVHCCASAWVRRMWAQVQLLRRLSVCVSACLCVCAFVCARFTLLTPITCMLAAAECRRRRNTIITIDHFVTRIQVGSWAASNAIASCYALLCWQVLTPAHT